MRPAPRLQSTALFAAWRAALLLLLLHFGFGRVGILLLIVQLCFHVEVRLRFSLRIRAAAWLGACRDTILALVLGKSLETLIELLAEVVVHFLQIVHGHRHLRTRVAITLLAAADENLDVLFVVRGVINSRDDIAGRERTIGAVWGLLGKNRRNDKRAVIRIERGRHFLLLRRIPSRRRTLLATGELPRQRRKPVVEERQQPLFRLRAARALRQRWPVSLRE